MITLHACAGSYNLSHIRYEPPSLFYLNGDICDLGPRVWVNFNQNRIPSPYWDVKFCNHVQPPWMFWQCVRNGGQEGSSNCWRYLSLHVFRLIQSILLVGNDNSSPTSLELHFDGHCGLSHAVDFTGEAVPPPLAHSFWRGLISVGQTQGGW